MVRRLVGRLVDQIGDPRLLRACYEAGPTGYGLHRLLESMGVRCDVIAPALIPRAPGDRVKTDKRDCRRLARLHRMGELVAIRVPSEAEEGVRDLCRARGDLIEDRRRARQRLSAFLLRHGVVWRDGSAWTIKHREWLGSRRFTDRAVQATYDRYLATATVREADVDAIEADLLPWFDAELFHDRCSRLACYRGIDRIGALTLVSEVCDWRRFESAHRHMAFVGLVPCRVLLRPAHLPRPSHQGRQRSRPAPTDRIGVGLPVLGQRHPTDHPPPGRRPSRYRHPGLAGPAPPVPPFPSPGRPQGLPQRGGRRRRPRTRRVRLGRNDRLTMSRQGRPARAGDGEVTVASLARRRTAAAGPIPVKSAASPVEAEHSEGQLPALARTAGPIREPQSGGSPTHRAPACR